MAVWLTLLPFARVQASDISDITDTYPYIYWLPDYKSLIVSNTALGGYTINDSNGILLRNLDENVYEQTSTTEAYLLTIANYQQGDCYTLVYNEVTGWEARQPVMVRKRSVATVYTAPMVTLYSGERVYTNGHSVPSPYSSGGTTLPNDIPPLDSVSDAINDALNATTNVTTQAITINQNINNTYNTYQSGGISEAEFKAQMETYRTQLEALSNNTGATLADQIAVNNALTNLDVTINQQVNNVSPALMTLLENIRSRISSTYNSYHGGGTSQSDAINIIKGYINDNLLKQTNSYTSVADRTAINGTIEYGNQIINAIGNHSDLDQDKAEAAESQEQEEIELLNDMLGVMQDQETEQIMNNQQMQDGLDSVNNWIQPMWTNKYFIALLISFSILVPICVVLDMRYKNL